MKAVIAILALVALAGCEAAQSAKQQVLQLQEDAEAYVNDNISMRRNVRTQNWMLIQMEVQRLQQEGDFAGAQNLLCRAYPPLVTAGTLRGSTDDLQALKALRATDLRVAGCGTLSDFTPPPSELAVNSAEPVASQPLE